MAAERNTHDLKAMLAHESRRNHDLTVRAGRAEQAERELARSLRLARARVAEVEAELRSLTVRRDLDQ